MSQPRLWVPREVVVGLVDEFIATGKRPCSVFKPDAMREAFAALPSENGLVDYHAASRVLDGFECYKLTGLCNRWTPWMRARLRDTKHADDQP